MTDKVTYDLTQMDPDRVRVVVTLLNEIELGVLYFEKAKKGWTNKPISMDGWRCVDAKVEGLYVHGGADLTPKDIVAHCQDLIRQAGL